MLFAVLTVRSACASRRRTRGLCTGFEFAALEHIVSGGPEMFSIFRAAAQDMFPSEATPEAPAFATT
eukprot:463818-Alexandrium_andersonii.AAC.1